MTDKKNTILDETSSINMIELLILLQNQRDAVINIPKAREEDKPELEEQTKGFDTDNGEIKGASFSGAQFQNINKQSLLDMIAAPESGGDPNIIYGGKRVNLTSMTINEVRAYQKEMVANGSPSSAVGKFQIISKTMDGLIKNMGLTGDEIFDEARQNDMALYLAERRGYSDFLNGDLPLNDFVKNLSKEWASLPKDMSGVSYYAGDGLNHALVSYESVADTLRNEFRANADEFSPSSFAVGAPSLNPEFSV